MMPIQLRDDRLYVTVDLVIMTIREGRLRVLLSRRTNPPYEGLWALPGRFVGPDESAETAARGLLDEMLPARDVYLEQLYTFTRVNRDPRGRVISVAYLAAVPAGRVTDTPSLCPFLADTSGQEPLLTSEHGARLDSGDLAFDHGHIIRMGVTRLQGKLDYTGIGFRFLSDTGRFSLGELQAVHEAILGRTLDSSNFRRTILGRYEKTGRIIQTDRTEKTGRGRPSGLYRLTD